MKILFLFFLVVMGTGWSSCSAGISCERITHQVCQGLGYNYTLLPNRFKHDTQGQAMLEMHQFYPLIRIGCSSSLRKFLCSMYMPVCSKTPLPSCRSLCEQVKLGCEPVMKRFGMSWPKKFKCSDFPDFGDKICISPTENKSALKIPKLQPATTISSTTATTTAPSTMDATTTAVASLTTVPPTTSATTTTVALTTAPSTTAATTTASTISSPTTPSSTTRKSTTPQAKTASSNVKNGHVCERITVPMCKGIGYNYTFMPNIFNHDSQAEAGLEIHQFLPLVKVGCPSSFRKLLCSVYAPRCTKTGGAMLPCRSLCEESKRGCEPLMKKFGFSWPAKLNCWSFPVEGGDRSCIAPDARPVLQTTDPTTTTNPTTTTDPTTAASPSRTRGVKAARASKCEKITIPLCKGIPYNQTIFPNRFGHRNQKQAGLEIRKYSLLLEHGRHKDVHLFFCSLYAPVCSGLETKLPPCRSLCEQVKLDSEPVMKRFGMSWPKKLKCSDFPDFGDKICISPTENKSDITTTRRPTAEIVISPTKISGFRTLLTKVQAVFTSPNYPNPYPHGIKHDWIIQLPDSYKVVKITIKNMRLEEDRNCLYDYIIIKDKMLNQVCPRHCGTYRTPYQVPVRGNKAIITFVSDGSTSKAGFVIKYRGLQNVS